MARKVIPKLDCIGVILKSWFKTTCGTASRLSSTMTRMPSRSDSSRRSAMPSMSLPCTSSAMRSTRRALFTWYGSSLTMIATRSPFFWCSMRARACICTEPWPVAYASRIPAMPRMMPAGRESRGRASA